MKKMLVTMLMLSVIFTQSFTSFAEPYSNVVIGPDGIHDIFEERPDGEPGYQWYGDSWAEMIDAKLTVDKKGTCTAITLHDPMRGLTLTFDFEISKDKLPKYKLPGNKFFYNYQANWLQVQTKAGLVIYTDMPKDPKTGKTITLDL